MGFVDGEGCFSIGFVRQHARENRAGYRAGYQVAHRFAVTQGVSGLPALEELKEFFGAGRVVIAKRHDDHRENLAQFIVNRRDDLLGTVLPFFRANPLRTAKKADFEPFAQCMLLIQNGRHLSGDGLVEIARIAETMNRRTSKTESDQNPQRPYAGDPGHWIMRWSHLHGDMQGRRACLRTCRPASQRKFRRTLRHRAKFLVG